MGTLGFTIIVGTLAIIIITGFYFFLKSKHNNDFSKSIRSEESVALDIPIDKLPTNVEVKENELFEIKDSYVIQQITSLNPLILNLVANAKKSNNDDLYRVILKNSGTLTKSKTMPGAFRGYVSGSKGISEQANLVKVTTGGVSAAQVSANIMNVASLVVGQYYMSQINSKLDTIGKDINEIKENQKNDFKGQVRSIITNVQDIAKFGDRIAKDKLSRDLKLNALLTLSQDSTRLLETVNIQIEDKVNNEKQLDYHQYLLNIDDLENLIFFQKTLLTMLQEISRMNLILGQGKITEENSYSLYNTYETKTVNLDKRIIEWQRRNIEEFSIDLENGKRKKNGFEGAFSNVTGLINDKWHYSKLDSRITDKINHQLSIRECIPEAEKINMEPMKTKILLKEGKIYYWLPEKEIV